MRRVCRACRLLCAALPPSTEDTRQADASLPTSTGANANFVYMNAHREMLPNGIAFGGDLDSRHFGVRP